MPAFGPAKELFRVANRQKNIGPKRGPVVFKSGKSRLLQGAISLGNPPHFGNCRNPLVLMSLYFKA